MSSHIDEHGYIILDEDHSAKSNNAWNQYTPARSTVSRGGNAALGFIIIMVCLFVVILIYCISNYYEPRLSNNLELRETTIQDTQPQIKTIANGDADPEGFYLQLNDRVISEDELRNFSETQINYIINAIYAMNGREFETEEYRDYFNSKSWYEPHKLSDTEIVSMMSSTMIRNFNIIMQFKHKMGWE